MRGSAVFMVLAAGVGFGMFLIMRGLRRRPPELLATVRSLQAVGRAGGFGPGPSSDRGLSGLQRPLSGAGLRLLEGLGLVDHGRLERRLRVLGKSLERHAYEKMLAAIVGLILPPAVGLFLAAAGTPVSPMLLLLSAILLSGLGFFYPDLPLSERVESRQRAFRHSLSSYLDLVSIILAGGGGTESALNGAAAAGDGWVFAEIRTALRRGELTGRTPWDMFEELGDRYGVEELRELAASISLAGGHGARVRQSLIAKAEALRSQQTTEIEAMAESNTEKMIVPVSIMVLGLMVFIGRGAIEAIGVGGPQPVGQQSQTDDP